MPRQARIIFPNHPHHIIQRGHNRQIVFTRNADFQYYLENLSEWKTELGCKVYAYCLMSNHVHLIIDPGDAPENLSHLMKRIAGRQTGYANRNRKRTGTLWEGRFKSSPIAADRYLLACSRYIELNPLRARLVDDPAAYPWSSCRVRTGLAASQWLDSDPCYLGLGTTPEKRAQAYRQWLSGSIADKEMELIREAAQRGRWTADPSFVKTVSEKTGLQMALRRPGRPKKGDRSIF